MRIITVSAGNPTDFQPLLPGIPERGESREQRASPGPVPRLLIRVTPADERNTLSSRSLMDVLDLTQRLLDFAAHEAAHGVRQELSDRRFVEGRVRQLAKLQCGPPEDETFAIAAVLPGEPVRVAGREVSARDVLARFVAVLAGLARDGAAFPTCAGVLHALEDFDLVLRRDVARVEYRPGGSAPFVLDRAFVRRLARQRLDERQVADHLAGVLTSVDLSREALRLRVGSRTVSGAFTPFVRDLVIRLLGQSVVVRGSVTYQGATPVFIFAQEIEAVD